jgi:2-oxoglutarate ferredoxin oxidoreductase subunit beta
VSLALGADATFVGRAMDSDRKGLTAVLEAAARHRGASLVEIYQDCPIFNDGSFDVLRKPDESESRVITIRHGEPITFGTDGRWAVVRRGFGLGVAPTAEVAPEDVVVHDATDHELAFALSRLCDQGLDHAVFGVLRQVSRPTYDDLAREQVQTAVAAGGADLRRLVHGSDTWTVRDGVVRGVAATRGPG